MTEREEKSFNGSCMKRSDIHSDKIVQTRVELDGRLLLSTPSRVGLAAVSRPARRLCHQDIPTWTTCYVNLEGTTGNNPRDRMPWAILDVKNIFRIKWMESQNCYYEYLIIRAHVTLRAKIKSVKRDIKLLNYMIRYMNKLNLQAALFM